MFKEALLAVNNKGFFTLYGLILLQIILVFTSAVLISMKGTIHVLKSDNTLDCVELYAINKAKLDLLNYEEEEESIAYLGYEIEFVYDDITCYITIKKDEQIKISSCLEWDDVENVVTNYSYIT